MKRTRNAIKHNVYPDSRKILLGSVRQLLQPFQEFMLEVCIRYPHCVYPNCDGLLKSTGRCYSMRSPQ
jgi:hypothetical protein